MPADKNAVTIVGAAVATMVPGSAGAPGDRDADYGLIRDAAVVIDSDRVAWVGPRGLLPAQWQQADQYPAAGRLITPGLVECHAHLLFGGDRPEEQGAAGIRAVAAVTRSASDDDLLSAAVRRAWWLIRQGVTTLEIKTGYGLDTAGELRLLRLAGQLRDVLPVRVRVTLLAGHTYPEGLVGSDREEYVIGICDELLPAALGLGILDEVEVYCEEEGGISMEDASTILETVYRKKVPTRVAADHLSDSAGGALAPAFYAKAAVYLNHTDDIAVIAMGKAGTTAVLVPAAALDPGGPPGQPPVDLLREHQVPIAVSTGLNPLTAPLADPLAAAFLGCTLYGLTRREALHGITATAARALALADGTGTLVAGGPADLVIWDAAGPEDLVGWLGAPLCQEVWAAGEPVAQPGAGR
jgi:imidazolonepropionase